MLNSSEKEEAMWLPILGDNAIGMDEDKTWSGIRKRLHGAKLDSINPSFMGI
jgi:hypothetical protein